MDSSQPRAWVRVALLLGAMYFVIGRVFSLPTDHVHAWRLAAWMVSGGVYAAHIWYEHFRLRSAPRLTAMHVAVAVAIGGFALAIAGMMHSHSPASGLRPAWLLALVLWPAFTALPAFLGALVAATLLPRPTDRMEQPTTDDARIESVRLGPDDPLTVHEGAVGRPEVLDEEPVPGPSHTGVAA